LFYPLKIDTDLHIARLYSESWKKKADKGVITGFEIFKASFKELAITPVPRIMTEKAAPNLEYSSDISPFSKCMQLNLFSLILWV